MDEKLVYNVNVRAMDVLAAPEAVKRRVPLTDRAEETVLRGRHTLERILDRRDHRFMVVVGPCSIHDPIAAMDYAQRLKRLADEVSDTLFVVMRVYFEKPRTTTGWKGLINDPHMNDSFDIEHGIAARAQGAARRQRARAARRHRGARPGEPAVSRRPGDVERDRCAHHRVANPP